MYVDSDPADVPAVRNTTLMLPALHQCPMPTKAGKIQYSDRTHFVRTVQRR